MLGVIQEMFTRRESNLTIREIWLCYEDCVSECSWHGRAGDKILGKCDVFQPHISCLHAGAGSDTSVSFISGDIMLLWSQTTPACVRQTHLSPCLFVQLTRPPPQTMWEFLWNSLIPTKIEIKYWEVLQVSLSVWSEQHDRAVRCVESNQSQSVTGSYYLH